MIKRLSSLRQKREYDRTGQKRFSIRKLAFLWLKFSRIRAKNSILDSANFRQKNWALINEDICSWDENPKIPGVKILRSVKSAS